MSGPAIANHQTQGLVRPFLVTFSAVNDGVRTKDQEKMDLQKKDFVEIVRDCMYGVPNRLWRVLDPRVFKNSDSMIYTVTLSSQILADHLISFIYSRNLRSPLPRNQFHPLLVKPTEPEHPSTLYARFSLPSELPETFVWEIGKMLGEDTVVVDVQWIPRVEQQSSYAYFRFVTNKMATDLQHRQIHPLPLFPLLRPSLNFDPTIPERKSMIETLSNFGIQAKEVSIKGMFWVKINADRFQRMANRNVECEVSRNNGVWEGWGCCDGRLTQELRVTMEDFAQVLPPWSQKLHLLYPSSFHRAPLPTPKSTAVTPAGLHTPSAFSEIGDDVRMATPHLGRGRSPVGNLGDGIERMGQDWYLERNVDGEGNDRMEGREETPRMYNRPPVLHTPARIVNAPARPRNAGQHVGQDQTRLDHEQYPQAPREVANPYNQNHHHQYPPAAPLRLAPLQLAPLQLAPPQQIAYHQTHPNFRHGQAQQFNDDIRNHDQQVQPMNANPESPMHQRQPKRMRIRSHSSPNLGQQHFAHW